MSFDDLVEDIKNAGHSEAVLRGAASVLGQHKMREAIAAARLNKWADFEDLTSLYNAPDELPTRLCVSGRGYVLTEGKVAVFSGHRKAGKTWVAAVAEAQEIIAGRLVVHVDFERQRKKAVSRLKRLGIGAHLLKQFRYTPVLPPVEAIAGLGNVLVVIDSWRNLQACVVPGSSANDGDAVEKVYSDYLNPLAEAGATVLILDHFAKTGNGSTFGSERKESAADLVMYIERGQPFSKTTSGFAVLTAGPDREGNFTEGEVIGYLWMPADDDHPAGYPDRPELRSSSPVVPTLAAFAEKPLTREMAVMEIAGQNRLIFGVRPLAAAVVAAHPELFLKVKDPQNSARKVVNDLLGNCQLVKDGAGNIDVPPDPADAELRAILSAADQG